MARPKRVAVSSSFAPARRREKVCHKGLGAEHHAVEHAEVVGQREVLVHHADAGRQRGRRITGRQRLAENFDAAAVSKVVAEQDAHQGTLAGPVLAQQREHLARRQLEVDIGVGDEGCRSAWRCP